MPVKAQTRAALVDTICDADVDQRVRKNAAKNLIESFPAVTKTLEQLLGLFPRPISSATFDALADAMFEVRRSKEKR